MDHTDWEDHKAEIERLYIRQDKTLQEVMKILRARNFHKSKKQYENAFERWGWRKKLSPAQWKIINRKISKRKRELGRDSEVYVDGVRYPPEKVQRGIRQGFISTADMYSVPSPKTSEGILVCTPTPTTVLEWPHQLPWLQFLQRMNGKEHMAHFPTLPAILPMHDHGNLLANDAMIRALQLFLPHGDLRKGSNMAETSKLAGVLQVIMPEKPDEGHQMTSKLLCSHRSSMGLQERFKLLFYLLSNNFSLISGNRLQYFDFPARHIKKEDELILSVLRISGLNTFENMKHLLAMPGLTPRAIAEKIFGSAVRCSDLETMTVILEAGMDPQTPVMAGKFGPLVVMTPLEYFCDINTSVPMVKLLLLHSADVNTYQRRPCLLSALRGRDPGLVDLLISHGANFNVCFKKAEWWSSSDDILHTLKPFLDRLLVQDINNGKDRKRLATLLALSIKGQNVDWVELLLAREADVNSLHEVYFDKGPYRTTALGLAADRGNMEILRMLLTANIASGPQSTANANIIQPLTLAVDRGHADAALLLINCGGDINTADHCSGRRKTLFDRALKKGMLKICEYLLQMGAAVEEDTLQHFYGVRLCSLVAENDVDRILQLPLQKINLNYRSVDQLISSGSEYRRCNGTALGIAIETGCMQIIKTLLTAGATNTGCPLERIGGVRTAQYLNRVGLLPSILDSCGQKLLVAAIDADDDTLLEYLLLHLPTEKLSQRRTGSLIDTRRTPLETAILNGKLATMEALLARGARIADAELTAAVGRYLWPGDELLLRRIVSLRSPLRCKAPKALAKALKAKNRALVEILLCSGLDLTGPEYSTVLATVAINSDEDLFQQIIMTIQWSKEVLGSAFTTSIQHRKRARMQYLHDAGADLDQCIPHPFPRGGLFPLQTAVENKDISVIKTLIAYGCHPDQSSKSSDWKTPLQIAAEDGNIEIVNLLLEAGADPDRVPIDLIPGYQFPFNAGMTALQSAVKHGDMELVERLLDAGADVNSAPHCDSGATALQIAAIQGFIGIARRLLELGADVNAGRAARCGRTAFEGAAEHGRLDMLQFLLANGALIDGRGRRQYIRAVKLAEWNGHLTIATFLRSHGQWTAVDTIRADMESYETDRKSEPDYENDLAWDYKIS